MSHPDDILCRKPPAPWCRACGEDWTEEPCCDVRRGLLSLSEGLSHLQGVIEDAYAAMMDAFPCEALTIEQIPERIRRLAAERDGGTSDLPDPVDPVEPSGWTLTLDGEELESLIAYHLSMAAQSSPFVVGGGDLDEHIDKARELIEAAREGE